MLRISQMPNRVGDALQEAADHDPSAREDLALAKESDPQLNEYLVEAVFCVVGFATCMTLAKRAI